MTDPLKYAVVERERRLLVRSVPPGVAESRSIVDRYLVGTRLRLREVRSTDGTTVRKLGHKVRVGKGPAAVACTSCYLDDGEWAVLALLPAEVLRKTRHLVRRDGWVVAVDEHEDGTLVAEVDDGDAPARPLPDWLQDLVLEDVSDDERWTGAALARQGVPG